MSLLLLVMFLIVLVETIHNVSGGFEGIVIRLYGKHYNELDSMIRYNTRRRIWVSSIRATSRALDISGLIIGFVFGPLVMQSTHVRWQFYLAGGIVAVHGIYVLIRAGAFLIWLAGQTIKTRFLEMTRKRDKETGEKQWYMPVQLVQSVDEPNEMPTQFDPVQFLRFDVARLVNDMWYAIDMWESWKYRFVVFGPRIVLFSSRLVLYLLVIGKIVGLA
jgi:hypothetical protein